MQRLSVCQTLSPNYNLFFLSQLCSARCFEAPICAPLSETRGRYLVVFAKTVNKYSPITRL